MTPPDVLALMPKAELHLHLEGTVSPKTLWGMAARNHMSLPAASLAELKTLYRFESFDKFMELWLAMCACFRTPADYEHMVDAYVAECEKHNVRYVEAHFTPYNHERFGFGGARALEIVTRHLRAAEAAGGPVTRLILDITADAAVESGRFTLDLLEREANPLVVALGLGGPEEGFPRRLVAPFFHRARDAGYPTVAHAGETDGAEQVREAVNDLKVRRIQHGVRAVEDPATVALLAERDICCDVALTSNEHLTPFKNLAEHPIKALLAAGVPVSLGSDDPPFFGTDLTREYHRAHEEVGLDVSELWQINLNGLRYGLGETVTRRRLMHDFLAAGQKLGLRATRSAR